MALVAEAPGGSAIVTEVRFFPLQSQPMLTFGSVLFTYFSLSKIEQI